MNIKSLTKCLLGTTLMTASVANAGFFEYNEDSKLSKIQQNMLKVFFVEKSVQGISSMVSTFETSVLKDIMLEYKDSLLSGSITSLQDIILSYLLETSRKTKDLKAILKYDTALTEDLTNAEAILQEAITGDKDGLFNGIIRETLKSYKKCLTEDEIDDKEQLTEAYNVLWDTVVSAWDCDFSGEFWDNLVAQYPEAKLGGILTGLRAADGKNACEKIASLLESIIQKQIENIDCCCSCCGPCCRKTYEITSKASKTIIAILPTIVQLVITIMTAK